MRAATTPMTNGAEAQSASVPLIDVLIPVYNAAATVADAVGSIQAQTMRDIRIIVIDDGSTDATPEVLARVAAGDLRVQIVRQANGGIVDALNAGLALCQAEFIARHDADDLARPDRFAKQIEHLRANPDCVANAGSVQHIDHAGRPMGHIARLSSPDLARADWAPAQEPYLMHPFLMMRRAPVQQIGGYRYVFHSEDSDLYWRLQEIGRLHNLDDVLGEYRLHADSVSSSSLRNGRVSALNSQRSAISALRRRAGKADFSFPKQALTEYHEAGTMAAMFKIACRDLTADEASLLEVAFAAKLVDLASYRPYELMMDDCRFIGSAIARHAHTLQANNQKLLDRTVSGTAARLIQAGKFREAAALTPSRLYPRTTLRLAMRCMLPPRARKLVKKSLGRPDFWK